MSGARVGALVALAGLALGIVAAVALPALPLPVTADLSGPGGAAAGQRVQLAEVAGRLALLVPAALAAALLLLTGGGSPRLRRLAPVGAAAPIAVFVVAQLNGLRDVGALVLVYAAAGAGVLIRALPGRAPWSIAAAIGVVPWGVVALQQVGAGIAGGAVPAGVRVLTVLVLAAAIAEFVRDGSDPGRLRPAPALVALAPALLAAGSLLVVLP